MYDKKVGGGERERRERDKQIEKGLENYKKRKKSAFCEKLIRKCVFQSEMIKN